MAGPWSPNSKWMLEFEIQWWCCFCFFLSSRVYQSSYQTLISQSYGPSDSRLFFLCLRFLSLFDIATFFVVLLLLLLLLVMWQTQYWTSQLGMIYIRLQSLQHQFLGGWSYLNRGWFTFGLATLLYSTSPKLNHIHLKSISVNWGRVMDGVSQV